ncbi:MAG: Uma2 family endonuclease, partial [Chloroflexota bacterium]|nr:Uma2 family endonuclease [Chloroflexota bacterium]
MVVQQRQRVSVAEFDALPDDGNRHELVRGEVRVMPPSKGRHGQIEAAIVATIDRYLDDKARTMGWEPRQGLDARERLVGFTAVSEFGLRFS